MRSSYPVEQTMDLVTGRRVFNASWLSANLGLSIVQMLMLAQAWNISQHALVPACMMSSWTIGALMGTRVGSTPGICGSSFLAGTLLWLGGSSFVSWHISLIMVPPVVGSFVALTIVALLLGASSSAWLSHLRSWPSVGERTALVRGLVGLTVGLVVVWLLPRWAGLLAVICCLPKLSLDTLLVRCRSLPMPQSIVASWIGKYWTTDRWQLQLDGHVLSRNWLSALVACSTPAKGYRPLTLLAGGVGIMLGSIWGAIPTPFAAGLQATHSLEKLGWLLGGQIGILLVGACYLCGARGVIGLPERLLPAAWQPRLRSLLLLMPVGMAVSLMALGLPFLQAPWWLALSLASYTLADAIWGILFPRLRPDLGTRVLARRDLLSGHHGGWLDTMQLPYGRVCEARATLQLATMEGVFIAAMTPVIGWVIDWRGNVDEVLIMVSLVFFLCLTCALGGYALFEMAHRPSRERDGLVIHGTNSGGNVLPHRQTTYS